MKKILMALGVAAIALTSCNGNGSSQLPKNATFGDTIAAAYGQFIASQQLQQYDYMMEQMSEREKANYKKEQFMKGLTTVIKNDSTNIAYLMGLSAGLRIYNEIYFGPAEAGVVVNPDLFLNNFKKVYMADSLDIRMDSLQNEMQVISIKMQMLMQQKREAELMNSDEYKTNAAEGEKYVEARMKEGFQKSESGLVYKIEDKGNGEPIKKTDRLVVKYVGKHTNGDVFDKSSDEGARLSPSSVVPGFSEGLMLLGKGGKATLVIPGNLAYGNNGAPGAKIGVNETLVFDIEILDVNPEK